MKVGYRARALTWLVGAAGVGLMACGGTAAKAADGVTAVRAIDFLNSIGANSAISRRGENLQKTIECAKYVGIRWFRAGNESDIPLDDIVALHKQAGVRFSWGLLSGGTDVARLISTAKQVEAAGALLAFEGNNEPNNWGVTYQGQEGGRDKTWVPVAKLQSDLYKAVKSDPVLRKYPVWSLTEGGAETDNVGLQFLTTPADFKGAMPPGTKYADYANCHNYFYHPSSPGLMDNRTWNAADPSPACKVDGLYGEYGVTWRGHFPGYSQTELDKLPRVTTETGTTIGGPVTEEIQALNFLTLYLDQYKRGWSYTALYLLRDRVDEAGNQTFGFYKPDYTPRKGGVYLHNLTTILADRDWSSKPGTLSYAIANEPATVHDMLMQKSDGTFELVVWGERVQGSDAVSVMLGAARPLVRVYDPTVGTAPIKILRNVRFVPLTMTDHPFILEIPGR